MHKPLTMVNGSFCDQVSVLDRGLQYGHGLFETMRVEAGRIPLLSRHFSRLINDAPKLLLPRPELSLLSTQIDLALAAACAHWQRQPGELYATIKVMLTAGEGGRGYRSPLHPSSNLILQIAPRTFTTAEFNSAVVCSTLLSASPLAGVKHCNRIEQVLAANELVGTSHFEGLVCDQQGYVVEGISSNMFVLKDGQFYTPSLSSSGVNGVMRQFLLESANGLHPVSICQLTVDEITDADQLFVVNSNWGVVAIDSLHTGQADIYFNKTREREQFIALGESAFTFNSASLGV